MVSRITEFFFGCSTFEGWLLVIILDFIPRVPLGPMGTGALERVMMKERWSGKMKEKRYSWNILNDIPSCQLVFFFGDVLVVLPWLSHIDLSYLYLMFMMLYAFSLYLLNSNAFSWMIHDSLEFKPWFSQVSMPIFSLPEKKRSTIHGNAQHLMVHISLPVRPSQCYMWFQPSLAKNWQC